MVLSGCLVQAEQLFTDLPSFSLLIQQLINTLFPSSLFIYSVLSAENAYCVQADEWRCMHTAR